MNTELVIMGIACIVVPVYHPYAVLKEPRHRYSIRNGHQECI